MTTATLFDLASLTKPLATTLAVMLLCQQGRLGWTNVCQSVLPAVSDSDKSDITIAQSCYPYLRPAGLRAAVFPTTGAAAAERCAGRTCRGL